MAKELEVFNFQDKQVRVVIIGTWKMSKSPYSPHECPQWYYNEIGY